MQKTVFLALLFLLSGCSILPFISRLSDNTIAIASDIPASTIPCVNVERSNQSELSIRESISSEVATAFSASNFKELENYYSLYSQRTSRTPGGRWKLQFFYRGFLPTDSNNEQDWVDFEPRFLQWIQEYPNSSAAHIAYSYFLVGRAWHVRGGGYAHEVSREAWSLFDANIEFAGATLQESKEFASADPQWYATMLNIAIAQSWSRIEVKELLQEALSKESYYQETYQTAFEYLLPKWYGSFEAAEAFADDAVAITNNCEGQGMYARIYWRALDLHIEFQDNPFETSKVSWDKMKMGFEDIITRYPDAWNINSYARFACLAQDKETTRRLINRIGNEPILDAWNEQVTFPACQKWAFEP